MKTLILIILAFLMSLGIYQVALYDTALGIANASFTILLFTLGIFYKND